MKLKSSNLVNRLIYEKLIKNFLEEIFCKNFFFFYKNKKKRFYKNKKNKFQIFFRSSFCKGKKAIWEFFFAFSIE